MDRVTGLHWLYKWIDEYDIPSSDVLSNVLAAPGPRNRLFELMDAGLGSKGLSPSDIPNSGVVVAGLGLDLLSPTTCIDFECRSTIADSEFSQVLHYFDAIVMEGPSGSGYARILGSTKDREERASAAMALAADDDLMLHLRKTGLVNYIIFGRRTECYCEEHLHEYARSLDVADLIDDDKLYQTARDVSRAGLIGVEERGPRLWCGYFHEPDFVGTTAIQIRQKTRPKKHDVAFRMLRRQLDETIFDAALAREAGLPLASLGNPRFFARDVQATGLHVEDVALRVQIPVLGGLSTEDFIRLRESEYDHFRKFQNLTAEAIEETIREANVGSPDQAAERIWRRKIRPQLDDLELKMAASQRAFTRKIVAGASFGAVSAAIGSWRQRLRPALLPRLPALSELRWDRWELFPLHYRSSLNG